MEKEKIKMYRVHANPNCGGNIPPARFWHRRLVTEDELPSYKSGGWAMESSNQYDYQFGDISNIQIMN